MTQNDQAAMNEQLTQLRLQGLSIDGDNRYKQDLIDAVIGAMMFGAQGANPPPSGHWLEQFYVIAREEREALARVEAERDEAREFMRINAKSGLHYAEQRDALKAQLAEAVGLLRNAVGILQKDESDLDFYVSKFLARHSQAEQQEAQGYNAYAEAPYGRTGKYAEPPARMEQQEAQYISIQEAWEAAGGNPGIKADREQLLFALNTLDQVCDEAQAQHQEAQGAQAEPANFGQELEAFEKWRHTQADSLRRCGYPEGADAFIRLGSVQWAGWQARAALATQPAAGEPKWSCLNAWFLSLEEGRQAVLREDKWMLAGAAFDAGRQCAAPPAAAHGDEAVAVVGTVPDGSGFKSLDFKADLQDLPDGTKLYARRSQGDGETRHG